MSVEPIRVLCVDDDADFVDMTAAHLEREDHFTVITERRVHDGLDRLEAESIDCIVSDYEVPNMDGLDFLRAVRESHPELPFILFTARGSEDVAEKAIREGVSSYIQKESGTSNFTVLANRIENTVSQHRAQQRAAELEQKHELVAQTATDAFWTVEPQSNTVTVSDGIEQFGYDPDTEFGREWFFERVHPDDRRRIRQHDEALFARNDDAFDELTEERGRYSIEYRFRREDGTFAECLEHGTLLFEDGEPVQMVGTMSHITEREGREQQLQHYRTLTQTASDVVIRIDAKSTIQDVNPAASDIFGYEPDELIGESLTKLMSPDMAEDHLRGLQDYLRKGERSLDWEYIELTGVHADGTEVPIAVSFSEYEYDGDHYFTGIVRDITERKAREQELERETERLERFASVLSHDLRNPVSVAEGFLDMAQEECDSSHLAKVEGALDRTNSIIEDVLTLAREGDRVTETAEVSLERVAVEAWDTVEHGSATLAVADSPSLLCDRGRIRRLLENLFRNAIEHGGDDVRIRVDSLAADDGFYVADDGRGIAETDIDRLFECGYSADDGTGFGLAIVEQIVEAHGWTITATNGETGGARFEIRQNPSGQ